MVPTDTEHVRELGDAFDAIPPQSSKVLFDRMVAVLEGMMLDGIVEHLGGGCSTGSRK